ncbi:MULTISPECIES: hypothetical protein [Olivibacter]|jgi:hypothetical protein|uniref:Uncharacterized protein n=1 Tax=Olivibacter oleidegradans TaxID=760123 RepID=A0ABV6HLU8_9SPHI|nr:MULTISPECIES: hypothetical protein [Olivibacter]MDM8175897.1 hypothetical protein [Olivibacter sp. 47]MDX3914521.1 hypothetical protein [Pseudosphingobacterium sp.]QEL02638.1 hypothetical protein FKG96_18045 [Olivibacter sp. LS-1]
MNQHRLYIYPKDVTIITGKGIRHAQRLLRTVHVALGKRPHQPVTFPEFARYMGLDEQAVREACIGTVVKKE